MVQRSDNYGLVTFTSRIKLHSQWSPRLRRLVCRGWTGLPWCSSWFPGIPGTEVDDARDDSWRCCFTALALLGC
jgi:hypothetical protein